MTKYTLIARACYGKHLDGTSKLAGLPFGNGTSEACSNPDAAPSIAGLALACGGEDSTATPIATATAAATIVPTATPVTTPTPSPTPESYSHAHTRPNADSCSYSGANSATYAPAYAGANPRTNSGADA